jgi:branched-chain amino acid transport system ATP-binding protein
MLQLDQVTVDFGGLRAVDHVSFKLDQGELLGLIGPNGAGKTTLMKSITGQVTPAEGSIQLFDELLGKKPTHIRIRMGIGLSQQIVSPFHSMTVLDNVAFAAGKHKTANPLTSLFKTSRQTENKKAIKILTSLGLGDVLHAEPSNLPLGYLKRVELARALALKPKLLLLDEPLAGLNQTEATKLADILKALNQKQGQTIILIEHNLSEVIRICDRLVVIDNGIMIEEGEPRTVMNDPVVRAAYLGKD